VHYQPKRFERVAADAGGAKMPASNVVADGWTPARAAKGDTDILVKR